jgi:hypothetical protein
VASPLAHPSFQRACSELGALGFSLSERPFPGSRPYAVIGGRSNPRWWLVPLDDRRVTAAGLALFQPVLAAARFAKAAALSSSRLGLAALWARSVLHLGGRPPFEGIFGAEGLRYAFFTGTESPHRKLAVQVMAEDGRILGFAKATLSSTVGSLLSRECSALQQIGALRLTTALVPRVLFQGAMGPATVLVTDTRKSGRSRVVTALGAQHLRFIEELATRTSEPGSDGTDWLTPTLRQRLASVEDRLSSPWRHRLHEAIDRRAARAAALGPRCLSHGDFTPWNTFIDEGGLYVFDWEYASREEEPASDLLHFVLTLPATRRAGPDEALGRAGDALRLRRPGLDPDDASASIAAYLCGHALSYVAREPGSAPVATWPGEPEVGALLDALKGRTAR